MFKQRTALAPAETFQQLFECCDDELGNDLLRGSNIDIAMMTEHDFETCFNILFKKVF